MKRIFFALTVALIFLGCQKSDEDSTSQTTEAINFTAGMLTRSDMKSAWNVGDEIAIFACDTDGDISSDDLPLRYKIVDESGTLEAVGDAFYDEGDATYIAIHPYMEGYLYKSYEEKMNTHFCDTDILKAEANYTDGLDRDIAFQFEHIFARLDMTFQLHYYSSGDSAELSFDDLRAEFSFQNSNGSTETTTISYYNEYVYIDSMSESLFVLAGTISDAKIDIYKDGEFNSTFDLSNYTFSTVNGKNCWESGVNYTFTIDALYDI